MLMVAGPCRPRDVHARVYKCVCTCKSANCPAKPDGIDIEESLLNTLPVQGSYCPLQGSPTIVPYPDLVKAVRRIGTIKSQPDYNAALVRGGILPKGSPINPRATYGKEWTSWAVFLDNPRYHSLEEALDSLKKITDMDTLRSMPEIDKFRFLMLDDTWRVLEQEARRLGIPVEQIIERADELFSGVNLYPSSDDPDDFRDSSGRFSSPIDPNKKSPKAPADPRDLVSYIEWGVRELDIDGLDTASAVFVNWLMELWRQLDRWDSTEGGGFRKLKKEVLSKLEKGAPLVVKAFMDQFNQVVVHKTGERNWMQAYALWYAINNHCWINLGEPGVGKTRTIPMIVSHFDIRLTVIIAPSKLVAEINPQITNEIRKEDKRPNFYYAENGIPPFVSPNHHNYIFINKEKFQGERRDEIVNALIALKPGQLIIDEVHGMCSKEDLKDEFDSPAERHRQFTSSPRTEALMRLVNTLRTEVGTRIGLLTGTPIRTSVEEVQTILTFLGVPGPYPKGRTNIANAIAVRDALLARGFFFENYKRPKLEVYFVFFRVPEEVADMLNEKRTELLQDESIRIPYALEAVRNTRKASVCMYDDETQQLTPVKHPPVNLFADRKNPVFFTSFVNGSDGPVERIRAFLRKMKMKFYECTGNSPDSELQEFLTNQDGALIASSTFMTGIDGAHKASDTLISLGIPPTDANHKQLVARLWRPGSLAEKDVREVIVVAENVAFDVKRFRKLFQRRDFSDCILYGRIPSTEHVRNDKSVKKAYDSFVQRLPKAS